jgi:hypothetical protein
VKLWPILPLLAALGGCVTTQGPASVSGECAIFEAPRYAIRGKTQYDQDWADSTIEGGVGGCHWTRPAPRPAALDAPHPTPKPKPAPVKKPTALQRIKAKVWPTKPVAPVAVTPIALPLPPEPTPSAPPARSIIDELLNPGGK